MKKDKKPKKEVIYLTAEQKDKIHTMFFGPYLDKWKDKKGIVLNTNRDIADRLNVSLPVVTSYTNKISEEHFERVYNLRLKEIKENETREKRKQQARDRSASTAR